MKISWLGVDETLGQFDNLLLEIRQSTAAAMAWYGQAATTEMKTNHEHDAHDIQRYINRTWNLTNSIAFEVQTHMGGTTRLMLHATAWYAPLVEHGTPRSRAYPFFWPAVYGLEETARTQVINAFLKALDRQAGWAKERGDVFRGVVTKVPSGWYTSTAQPTESAVRGRWGG